MCILKPSPKLQKLHFCLLLPNFSKIPCHFRLKFLLFLVFSPLCCRRRVAAAAYHPPVPVLLPLSPLSCLPNGPAPFPSLQNVLHAILFLPFCCLLFPPSAACLACPPLPDLPTVAGGGWSNNSTQPRVGGKGRPIEKGERKGATPLLLSFFSPPFHWILSLFILPSRCHSSPFQPRGRVHRLPVFNLCPLLNLFTTQN